MALAAPLVSWRHAADDGDGTLFAGIADELAQIPAVGVDHLVAVVALQAVDVAAVGNAGNVGTGLAGGDVAHVVMSELDDDVVAGAEAVVDLFPAPLLQIGAGTASGLGGIDDVHQGLFCLFVVQEQGRGDGGVGPAPHAFGVVGDVLVLHGAVAAEVDGGLAVVCRRIGGVPGVGRCQVVRQPQPGAGADGLGSRAGIQPGAELAAVDFVQIEVVVHLRRAETLELACRGALEVDEGHVLLGADLLLPAGEGLGLAFDGAVAAPAVSRGERAEDGVSAAAADVADEAAHVFAVGVDDLAFARLLDGDDEAVGARAGYGGACAAAVVGAVVVMPQLDDDPVALADALQHVGPQAAVEGAAAGAAQGMVLHADALRVEVEVRKVAPPPLAVVAVAQGARAHGAVAHEEEHGVVAHAAAATDGACRCRLVQAVQREVRHTVHVLHRARHLTVRHLCLQCHAACQQPCNHSSCPFLFHAVFFQKSIPPRRYGKKTEKVTR